MMFMLQTASLLLLLFAVGQYDGVHGFIVGHRCSTAAFRPSPIQQDLLAATLITRRTKPIWQIASRSTSTRSIACTSAYAASLSTCSATRRSTTTLFSQQFDRTEDEDNVDSSDTTGDKNEDDPVNEEELAFALKSVTASASNNNKDVIRPYKPRRSWLWRQWRGTILQHSLLITSINTILSLLVVVGIRLIVAKDLSNISTFNPFQPKALWALGLAPDLSHPLISRFAVLEKVWKYQMGFVTFALTFFLGQAYGFWREVYTRARMIQGRLNDIHLLLATHAKRKNGRLTPESNALLTDVGDYSRLFHLFFWASHAKQYNVLLTPTGLDRMVQHGILTQKQLETLQQLDLPAHQWHNACLEWMMIRWTKGINEEGLIDTSRTPVGVVLLERATELRSTYASIADKLAGRMPLAYVHLLQFLTDTLLFCAPVALYSELGAFSVVSVVLLTIFYGGFLDLGKVFLDPLNNDGYCRKSMYMDLSVLLHESNAGSIRWRDGAEVLPW